ncbi:MAG TPA: type VI secretion protein IcmF/TssM N-terminal domain-containing protein [Chthoniobacteraceae bacterium]|nr:type VI secretion protein IcmF/TssM N-terminal domain-containing protein [Chthoniobacteraceae bacterium]
MPKLPENLRPRVPKLQVETFHSGHAKSWFWRVLPSPITMLYCVLAAGSVTGVAYFLGDRVGSGGHGYQYSLVAIAVMTVIAGIAGWVRKKRGDKGDDRERAAGFEEAVKGSAGGWDTSVSDVAEIARLDDLRTKFQQGLEVFSKYGKDLYELPWYVIVGEPGSGKTEAIRHSELRFPQGLQDKLQGVGGTYSMNWWFTNNAVLLDTAGAMLTNPEAGERFAEFLKLLREHRTDFPINGLILTIPVDQLLIDPPHIAEEKARAIGQQLGIVQQALDVRFPLYLLISKSDRLPGFREFFDAEGQAAFELQMVGWSNPDPVGEPFDPARLREALGAVADRLQARALALLADPVPRVDGRRRLDEVDRIYGFPETIRSLETRLQCYLDTIFQTGTWAAKTPFFRGLYFTSALREGSELDQALAKALNVNVQQLPSGGIFTQEKSVFLRDVFLSKIFPERGLVTRLRDIGALLRRRLLLYYGSALAVLLVGLLFAYFVHDKMRQQLEGDPQHQIEGEQSQWLQANASWNNGTLLAPLVRQSTEKGVPPTWHWIEQEKNKPLVKAGDILGFSEQRLHYSWVFRPLRWMGDSEWHDFEVRRRAAGLTLFEASVFKPVLDAARERIRWDTAKNATRTPGTEERLAKAYTQLVKLETWTVQGATGAPKGEKEWQPFFEDLLAYILDKPKEEVAGHAKTLAERTEKGYGHASIQLSTRDWLAEHEPATDFSPLFHAATLIFGQTNRTLESEEQRIADAAKRKELLQDFEAAERLALEWSRSDIAYSRAKVEESCMGPMRDAVKRSNELLARERGGASASVNPDTIMAAARVTADLLKTSADAAGVLRTFSEPASRLAGQRAITGGDEAGWNDARARFAKYEERFKPMGLPEGRINPGNMIGRLKSQLDGAILAARPTGADAAPPAKDETTEATLLRFFATYRRESLVSEVYREYRRQLKTDLTLRLKFPLVNTEKREPGVRELADDCKVLEKIAKDADELNAMPVSNLGVEEREPLVECFARLSRVIEIGRTLLPTDKSKGLQLTVDGVAPPGTHQEMVVPPTFGVPPQPQMVQVQDPGVKSIEVNLGAGSQFSRLDGEKHSFPYDGFKSVSVTITRTVPGSANDARTTFSRKGNWELLHEAATSPKGGGRFLVDGKIGFTLESVWGLPFGKWPTLSELGL